MKLVELSLTESRVSCLNSESVNVSRAISVPINREVNKNVKVKESRYRPGVAQRVPGGLGSQVFMTFGTRR